jgi:protease-4
LLIIIPIIVGISGIDRNTGGNIGLIHVDGVINSGTSDGGLFSGSVAGSERLVNLLEKARKDDDIKAVVLRINSPGGSAAASEEIYQEVLRVKKEKPVYASMGDVAASGGYYIAAACDKIYANGATATGSIGVIMESPDMSGLYKKLGIDMQVVKSGKYKDMGNPARALTPEEKQLIQGMINDTYEQFVSAVSNGRKMPTDKVKALATGQIYTGRQAEKLGLIDELGGLRDTVLAAAKAGGISGEPEVKKYGKGGFSSLFDDEASTQKFNSNDLDMLTDMVIRKLTQQGSNLEGIR